MVKDKKLLCICSSTYQVIVLTKIIKCFYHDFVVDIIFTNYMKKYKFIANNYQMSTLCRWAYPINVDCIRYSDNYSSQIFFFEDKYDEMLIHNFGKVCTYFVNLLEEQQNIHVNLSLYEDGMASYSKIYEIYYVNAHLRLKKVKQIYAFEPDFFDWVPPFRVTRIPKISTDDLFIISFLNKVFEYDKCMLSCPPIIYVESIAGLYGYDSQEKEILSGIVQKIGKDKLIVKRHPRNIDYILEGVNYFDSRFQFIPFELMLLNKSLNDKILLTISSNGVYSAVMMFDIPITAVSLLGCMRNRPDFIDKGLKRCIDKMHKKNPDFFYLAYNIKDAVDYLNKLMS